MANLATFLNSSARTAPLLLMALYFQSARGESPFVAGLKVLPISGGVLIASPLAGVLSRWYSARLLLTGGLCLCAAGLLILAFGTAPDTQYPVIGLGLALTGLGSGFFLTPNTTSIMSTVAEDRRGVANGLRSRLQNTGVVVSTALSRDHHQPARSCGEESGLCRDSFPALALRVALVQRRVSRCFSGHGSGIGDGGGCIV